MSRVCMSLLVVNDLSREMKGWCVTGDRPLPGRLSLSSIPARHAFSTIAYIACELQLQEGTPALVAPRVC